MLRTSVWCSILLCYRPRALLLQLRPVSTWLLSSVGVQVGLGQLLSLGPQGPRQKAQPGVPRAEASLESRDLLGLRSYGFRARGKLQAPELSG